MRSGASHKYEKNKIEKKHLPNRHDRINESKIVRRKKKKTFNDKYRSTVEHLYSDLIERPNGVNMI